MGRSSVKWKSGRREIASLVAATMRVPQTGSQDSVHSPALSPSHCLQPHANHCLIIQAEQPLSRLLCAPSHYKPFARVCSFLCLEQKKTNKSSFKKKLSGVAQSRRVRFLKPGFYSPEVPLITVGCYASCRHGGILSMIFTGQWAISKLSWWWGVGVMQMRQINPGPE